jgi:hypothetical protein
MPGLFPKLNIQSVEHCGLWAAYIRSQHSMWVWHMLHRRTRLPIEARIYERKYNLYQGFVRFEVFMVVTLRNAVSWDVTLCGSCKNREAIRSSETSVLLNVKQLSVTSRSPTDEPLPLTSPCSPQPCLQQQNQRNSSDFQAFTTLQSGQKRIQLTMHLCCDTATRIWSKLQAPSPLLVVSCGHLYKEFLKIIRMLLLPVNSKKESSALQIQGLQTRECEMQTKKSQGAPKTTTGRPFSSNLTITDLFFVAAVRHNTE